MLKLCCDTCTYEEEEEEEGSSQVELVVTSGIFSFRLPFYSGGFRP